MRPLKFDIAEPKTILLPSKAGNLLLTILITLFGPVPVFTIAAVPKPKFDLFFYLLPDSSLNLFEPTNKGPSIKLGIPTDVKVVAWPAGFVICVWKFLSGS